MPIARLSDAEHLTFGKGEFRWQRLRQFRQVGLQFLPAFLLLEPFARITLSGRFAELRINPGSPRLNEMIHFRADRLLRPDEAKIEPTACPLAYCSYGIR